MKFKLTLLSILFFRVCDAQDPLFSTASILSHNDYEQPIPFYNAYDHGVGFIEADVFLEGNTLMVAHTRLQITKEKTLEAMYLKPLQAKIVANNGSTYTNGDKMLTLMIDLKTEGVATLSKLVDILKNYPALTSCASLRIVISGNVPAQALWSQFPSYIFFDGRPSNSYSVADLERVAFISDSFGNYARLTNDGTVSDEDLRKIKTMLLKVRQQNKLFRFWGVPDTESAWRFLMQLPVDIIGTDHVSSLATFLKSK